MSTLPPPPPSPPPEMKQCPYCLEQIIAGATRCRYCRTWLRGNPLQNEWYRSRGGRIAGVCQGLSEQFLVPATLLRIMFILLTVFGAGIGLLTYVALWIIMPLKEEST